MRRALYELFDTKVHVCTHTNECTGDVEYFIEARPLLTKLDVSQQTACKDESWVYYVNNVLYINKFAINYITAISEKQDWSKKILDSLNPFLWPSKKYTKFFMKSIIGEPTPEGYMYKFTIEHSSIQPEGYELYKTVQYTSDEFKLVERLLKKIKYAYEESIDRLFIQPINRL